MVSRALAFSLLLTASCASVPVSVVEGSSDAVAAPSVTQALQISYEGAIYDRLRGDALRRVIVSSKMSGDPLSNGITVQGAGPLEFRADGTFVQVPNGRVRTVLRGTYEVRHDSVCLHRAADPVALCFGLFETSGQRYVAVYSRQYAPIRSVIIIPDKSRSGPS